MKSLSVTIQIKATKQYIHVLLLIYAMQATFNF